MVALHEVWEPEQGKKVFLWGLQRKKKVGLEYLSVSQGR